MTETTPRRPATGMPSNVAATVAYLGGVVTGVIMLIVEKDDRYVRFHAMQSTVTFLAVLVAHLVLTGLPVIGWILYVPFIVGVAILWVVLMVKAFRGERYKLPYLGDFVENQLK